MLFNSLEFAIFLPLVFLLYWFVFNRKLLWRNVFIVFISYFFYGWWDWRFLLLIAFTSFCSWGSGIFIEKFRQAEQVSKAKLVLTANILINLGILGFFKYFNFFVTNFVDAFASIGIHLESTSLRIILPVGISFYTFQALSYSIDIYRKQIASTRDIVSFFAYVSFFPQLVAGPIERATNLLPQFYKAHQFDYDKAADGMRQILWGLFKKVVVADSCAVYVNRIFETYPDQPPYQLLLAALFFAFQIYGDFSGYSDIAIGTGRLFGFNLMRNFNYPYFSRNIAEFWRRWHISLTTWFRDYVYIPLGGSRGGKWISIRNTLIIFIVSGFWHGANWTFVSWGAFNGLLFLPLLLSGKNRKYLNTVAENSLLPTFKEFLQMAVTFILILIGWILFRAQSMGQAIDYIEGMIHVKVFYAIPYFFTKTQLWWMIILLLVVEWIQRKQQHGLALCHVKYRWVRWLIYMSLLFIIGMFMVTEETPFIYFQF